MSNKPLGRKPLDKSKKKSYRVTLSFPPHFRPVFEQKAEDEGLSVAAWMRKKMRRFAL